MTRYIIETTLFEQLKNIFFDCIEKFDQSTEHATSKFAEVTWYPVEWRSKEALVSKQLLCQGPVCFSEKELASDFQTRHHTPVYYENKVYTRNGTELEDSAKGNCIPYLKK